MEESLLNLHLDLQVLVFIVPLIHIHYNDHKKYDVKPLVNLDVKIDLPMFNGELSAEKLDNWIRQIEVYCRIHKLAGDEANI